MANIQFSRMILKSSTGTFSIPNVPENINEYDYLVDGNFESSDLLDCELGVDKTNEKLYLRIDDEIVEVGGGGGSVSLSDGNGTTYNVDRVDLGGVLRSNDTIIKGATDSTSSLFLGGNAGGENLIQLSINAESLITQNLISYTGSNIGTYLNSNPGGFISHNNISLMSGVEAYTSIGNGGDTAYVRYNDNRIIDFYFWGGVPTGLGEWFSINGATFSEGVDFTGSGDPYVDVMTFYTGLNWGIDPTFISVEYDGDLSIRLKYSQPVKIEGLITGISFNENLYFTAALANGAGGAILYSDQSTLSINDFGDHTFTDGRIIKKGIEYTADYSATFVTHSLVDKQYVDNAIIGASTFSVDYIDFNTSYTPTQQEGRLHWDADYGTLDVDLEGNNINLKVGLDTLYYIKNQSGSTINKGSVVRASGTLGSSGRILGGLMVANGSVPHYYTLGIAGENILDGEDGYVYHFGLIKGMDTTGVPYGETWVDGDILYVSSTTPGGLTKVEPIEPNLKIQMAIVIDADNNGSIFIRPDLGSSLGDIHNIQTTGQSDGDLISYNQPGGYWEYTKELNGDYTISGTLSATAYYGDGSNLTGVGTLNNIIEDTTPQLGGNLDINGWSIISTGPTDISLTPAGTGNVVLGNFTFNAQQIVDATKNDYVLTYDSVSNEINLEAPSVPSGLISIKDSSGVPTFYSDLQTAINATSTIDSIEIHADIQITSQISVPYRESLTINLNGHRLWYDTTSGDFNMFRFLSNTSTGVDRIFKLEGGGILEQVGTIINKTNASLFHYFYTGSNDFLQIHAGSTIIKTIDANLIFNQNYLRSIIGGVWFSEAGSFSINTGGSVMMEAIVDVFSRPDFVPTTIDKCHLNSRSQGFSVSRLTNSRITGVCLNTGTNYGLINCSPGSIITNNIIDNQLGTLNWAINCYSGSGNGRISNNYIYSDKGGIYCRVGGASNNFIYSETSRCITKTSLGANTLISNVCITNATNVEAIYTTGGAGVINNYCYNINASNTTSAIRSDGANEQIIGNTAIISNAAVANINLVGNVYLVNNVLGSIGTGIGGAGTNLQVNTVDAYGNIKLG